MIYELKYLIKKPGEALGRFRSLYQRSREQTTLRETFITQTYYPLTKILRKNTILLDIGANIGDTAIYFAQFDKVKRVISYEKDQKFFSRGMENVEDSPYKNKIKFINAELNSALLKKEVSRPNVAIKCDIEGGEKEVFRGVDLKNVYGIVMETHNSRREMEKLLKNQGFEVEYKFVNVGVVFKEVGTIFAHR